MATVSQLIEHLRQFPPETPVAFKLHSEQCLLELPQVVLTHMCVARPDGWIQNERPDMPTVPYVLFPGN